MAQNDALNETQVCSFWKEFELDSVRSKLDEEGLGIASHQEASVKHRRQLAEATKDFRRAAAPDAVKEVGGLLKAYQEEIDRLTQRAKYSEAAFLDVYQKLYEAPDPAPMLQWALGARSRAAEGEAHMRKMAQELAEFKAERGELRNQELTVRRLEDKNRAAEAKLAEQATELEGLRARVEAESATAAATDVAEREAALEAALLDARASLHSMRSRQEATQSQLLSMQAQSEEERTGLQAQLELTSQDMERAQQRLWALEHTPAPKPAPAPVQPLSAGAEEALRGEVASLRLQVSKLEEQLEEAAEQRQQDAGQAEGRQAGLRQALSAQESRAAALAGELASRPPPEEALTGKESRVAALAAELASRPPPEEVAELKQQIRVLQAVGFGAVEGEEAGAVGSLEVKLLGKLRGLEHALTMSRLQEAQSAGRAEAAESRESGLREELQQQASLVQTLENDLLAAQHSAAGSQDLSQQAASSLSLPDPGTASGGDVSMVSVLSAQRDRFRAKATQLEDQLTKAGAEAAAARQEAQASKADSVALVERLHYVQGYQRTGRRKGVLALRAQERWGLPWVLGRAPHPEDTWHADDSARENVESQYQPDYEASLNPWGDWREREKASRRTRLGLVDRVMYEFGQIVYGSPWAPALLIWQARLGVFFYSLALHALVLFTLLRWGHASHGHASVGEAELQLLCQRARVAKLP